MHKGFLILLMLILCLPISFGYMNYTQSGTLNNYYRTDIGFFNENVEIDTATRPLTTPKQQPLVQDLDGDGDNEIIVIDAGNLRLYETKDLTVVDSYAIKNEELSNIIVYDIDNDGKWEIIFAETVTEMIQIIEYNGTHIFNDSSLNLSTIAHDDDISETGEMLLQCKGTNDCILFYSEDRNVGDTDNLWALNFDNESISNVDSPIQEAGWANTKYCFQFPYSVTIADYDNDGDDEYIFTAHYNADTGEVDPYIYYVGENVSNMPVLEMVIDLDDDKSLDLIDFPASALASRCNSDDTQVRSVTSPIVFDMDGSPSNGLETAVAVMPDQDQYVILSWESDGDFLDDYPELIDSEGTIVSNIFRADIMTDTGNIDFCVMGFRVDDNILEMTCGSESSTFLYQTSTFDLDISGLYNISQDTEQYANMVHSGQHKTQTPHDYSEIIMTYGVFEIDYTGNNDLDIIWANPYQNSSITPVDVEKVGREDLVLYTATNLWYIDDGYTLSGAYISDDSEVDPCIDSTWKVSDANDDNVTRYVDVTIVPVDVDANQVMAQATLYYGETFNQTAPWSNLGASGTTFPFQFVINETIGSGTLRLQANDTSNPTEIDIIDITISVGSQGVESGDCTSNVGQSAEEEEEEESETAQFQANNSITNSIEDIKDATGMNLSNTVIWLIIMAVVGGMVWWNSPQLIGTHNASIAFAVFAVIEFILFLLGIALGFMEVIYLWIAIILALAVLAFKTIRPIVTGG